MANRIIILAGLFLALALSVNWVIEESDEAPPNEPRNDPDLYMLNASIDQYNAKGKLQHRVQADRFTHFPVTDLTAMKAPSVSFGEQDEENPWRITSFDGRLLPASDYREEIVELWNNVLAQRTDNDRFIRISTESLTIYPARKFAETSKSVVIENERGKTSAAGMRADLDNGLFEFSSSTNERVTTVFKSQSYKGDAP